MPPLSLLTVSSFFLLPNVCLSEQCLAPSTFIMLPNAHWQQAPSLWNTLSGGSGHQALPTVLSVNCSGGSPEPFRATSPTAVRSVTTGRDSSFLGNLPLERLLPDRSRAGAFGKQSVARSGLLSPLVIGSIRSQVLFLGLHSKRRKSTFAPQRHQCLWSGSSKHLAWQQQGTFLSTEFKRHSRNAFPSHCHTSGLPCKGLASS